MDLSEEQKMYLQTIQFLDESTDGYLYLCDWLHGRSYFTDKICEKYPLPKCGQEGYSLSQWMDIVYSKDRKRLQKHLNQIDSGQKDLYNLEYRLIDKDGNKVWIGCKGIVQRNEDGAPAMLVGCMSELALYRMVDTLTGLRNMDKFVVDLKKRLQEKDGSLILLGVDNLKSINIKSGRSFGNYLLKTVTNVLEENADNTSYLYRLDGDRFAVILPDAKEQDVLDFYSAVKQDLSNQCTISAGVVTFKAEDNMDSDVMYQYAESALDRAKREGKNMLVFFSSEDYQNSLKLIQLQDEMEASIQEDYKGFYLYYQPQVDSQRFELYGAEALLRYESPSKGVVVPSEFIPLLEQSGQICDVGAWVLKTAMLQCKEWRKRIPTFHISVNISYVQLQQDGITEKVLSLLKEVGLPGDALTLELTESIQLQDYLYFNKIFYEWKRHGIAISIDDFGTGYSSLSYLKSIDVNEAKIDRCFVSNIQYNAYNYRLLSNMIELAHSVQIKVCCEGVETEEELMALQELHPDLLQGYWFAKPCTKAEIEQLYFEQDSEAYKNRVEKERLFRQLDNRESQVLLENLRREEISNIVEGMDEAVYVSDIDTYDLYYLNAAGRQLTGKYDYKGCKCYSVLQGRDAPCEFCSNKKLQSDEFFMWEQQNPYIGRHFILKDKLIPWQGKMARLEIAIDITDKEVVSNEIQKKLDFEQAIVDACKVIASESNGKDTTRNVIKILGEFYQGDRAYILTPNHEVTLWTVAGEWCAPGIASIEEHFPTDIEWLRGRKQVQIMVAPILRRNRTIGLVAVENARRHKGEKELVDTMAYFLGYRMVGEATEERLNDLLGCHYDDILSRTDVGLWVIRVDSKTGKCEMYIDKVMHRVMEIPEGITPAECYNIWHDRVSNGYCRHYVNLALESMIRTKKTVQIEYAWKSPSQNTVTVRWLGVRVADSNGMICVEGYSRIISNVERPDFLPRSMTSELFEYNVATKEIYFHSQRKLIAGEQKQEANFPDSWIESKIVHPHFVESFRDIFTNAQKDETIHTKEFLMQVKSGLYEWFQLKVKRTDDGNGDTRTCVVLLEPTERERSMELEYIQKKDFYEAMLSETVAYAEVDVESGHITRSGGLWKSYEEEGRVRNETCKQVMDRHINEVSCPEDAQQCKIHMDLLNIKEMYQKGLHAQKFSFRRYVDGQLCWMDLMVHAFKNQQTGNMYALMYLKNVDVEKKREIAQEIAAKYDSLTKVLNRTSFENEVVDFMSDTEKQPTGAMIMLDLDNFKAINDNFGHLKGDEALKQLTQVLKHTFRSQDIIARWGGDEFIIFVKDVTSKEILDGRMKQFFTRLTSVPIDVPLTCSAGIHLIKTLPFDYRSELEKVDAALYCSKNKGKNQYCYSRDSLQQCRKHIWCKQ